MPAAALGCSLLHAACTPSLYPCELARCLRHCRRLDGSAAGLVGAGCRCGHVHVCCIERLPARRQPPAHCSDHPSRVAGAPAVLAARPGHTRSRPSTWACSGSLAGVLWLPLPPMRLRSLACAVCDELSASVCCVLCVAGGGFLRAVHPAHKLLGQRGQREQRGWVLGRRAGARLGVMSWASGTGRARGLCRRLQDICFRAIF